MGLVLTTQGHLLISINEHVTNFGDSTVTEVPTELNVISYSMVRDKIFQDQI